MMLDYQIVNIVANTDTGVELDLGTIKKALDNCVFDPEVYFALIYKLDRPKLSVLVNRSGKIIFTGAKSILDIEQAREIFYEDLKSKGYTPKKRKIIIQNIVAVTQIKPLKSFQKILTTDLV